ncbi:thiamine phosphate synthase [Rothia santali]|uniref:thiamine phosphate synthase n=1 Tax=Rothia santali TaxID=2949643 RepID=UPI00281627C7|nr:thiamine phosphate synthase [Rothia santali]
MSSSSGHRPTGDQSPEPFDREAPAPRREPSQPVGEPSRPLGESSQPVGESSPAGRAAASSDRESSRPGHESSSRPPHPDPYDDDFDVDPYAVRGTGFRPMASRSTQFLPADPSEAGAESPGTAGRPEPQPDRDGAWRRRRLEGARLYLCTDLQRYLIEPSDGETVEALDAGALERFFEACFRGGVDIIQVRDKKVSVQAELEALRLLGKVASRHGGLSAANDRADVALLAGVDVFHVGQTDLTSAQVRTLLGPEVVVGRSCHDRHQVTRAAQDPETDYFCTGPVWETPTKPGRTAVGLGLPAFAAQVTARDVMTGGEVAGMGPTTDKGSTTTAGKPFFAIGGVDAVTVGEVVEAGAGRVVVVRAITEAADPETAARSLREALPAL